MDRYCFILNPTAGKGRARRLKDRIETYQKNQNARFEIVETLHPGHGEQLAREACKKGFTHIISVGGDGTLLEVVNGVAGEDVAVGIIPCGTGNDFSRTLGLPSDLEGQLQVISKGKERRVDLGKAKGRFFINVFSLGIDALITRETQNIKRYLPGSIAYIAATIKMLMKFRPVEITLNAGDKNFKGKVMLVAFGNGAFYGGGMRITPGAQLDSGKFQVCVVKALGKFAFLKLFPLVFTGRHVNRKEVLVFEAGHIFVESEDRVFLNADGDVVGECPVEVGILPGAVRVMTP